MYEDTRKGLFNPYFQEEKNGGWGRGCCGGEAELVLLTREHPREKGRYLIKEHFPLPGTSEGLLNSSHQWPEGG